MEWSLAVFLLVLVLTCTQVSCGRSEWKRLTRLESTIHQLTREVKDLKAVRCRQERTSETVSSPEEIKLAKETLTALEVESRALSQFDSQMRGLQTSLEQLSLHKNHQAETIESFRHELNLLKSQVESVVGKSGGSARFSRDTSSENAVKTLQWLLKSVSNLKADVNQMNQSLNISKTLQHTEEVQKQINLVQGEVSQLRHQWISGSAERQRMAAEVVQLRTDLVETTENHQLCLKEMAQMTSEIQSLKTDWNTSVETGTTESHSKSSRHGHWNHKFNELKNALQSVREMHQQLEQKMNRFTSVAEPASMETIEQRMDEVAQQYSILEAKMKVNEAALATLEASRNTIHEQIDMSDFQARETQLAVDQLHYNITQIQVQCEQALQRTEVTEDKLTYISENFSQMESNVEKDRITILSLQNRAMNETLQKCKDETREQIQDMKLQTVQYQIETIKYQIDAFNKTINSWNGAFTIANVTVDENLKNQSSSSEESIEE